MTKRTNAARKIDFYQETKRGIAALEGALRRSQERLERSIIEIDRERAIHDAQIGALAAELRCYKQRLIDLLDDDQKEHARITGCPEDEYAIQLIRLCKLKIDRLRYLND